MTFTEVISQPPYPGADPKEVAEIFVDKFVFSDWESVWVQHRWKDVYPIFRFVSAERDPLPQYWARLQIKPKDLCAIKLGGQLAITGVVTVRQTAYDPNSHAVSIQGVGVQWFTWRGAILDKKQEFKGGFVDVAKAVMAPFGVVPQVRGTIDPTEFKPPAHNEIGESVFQFLEKLAKERKVVLGGDFAGGHLLIGDRIANVVDELIEGVNILSCQCVINIGDIYQPYVARSQTSSDGSQSPSQSSQQEAFVNSKVLQTYSPLLVANEHPVWTQHEIDLRAETEAVWGDGTLIEATVVVYGWFTRSGVLWCQCVGESVVLNSPMTTLVGERLAIRSVTSTQDSQAGTRTTLDLVAPWYLNDKGIRAGATGSNVNDAPGNAQSTPNSPAVTGDPNQNVTDPQTGPG
jgi:prophage tail gpP-like protein